MIPSGHVIVVQLSISSLCAKISKRVLASIKDCIVGHSMEYSSSESFMVGRQMYLGRPLSSMALYSGTSELSLIWNSSIMTFVNCEL